MTKPNVTLTSPDNGYNPGGTGTQVIIFYYNVSDNLNVTQCGLTIDSSIVAYNTSLINQSMTNNISYSVSSGSHTWGINCTDEAGNIGNSSSRSLTLDSAPGSTSSSGGGGGGGGGGISTYSPSVSETGSSGGYSKNLGQGDKIVFKSNEENHTLIVKKIFSNGVNITIQSDPISLFLIVGEERKINLTQAEYYELYVKLESVTFNKVNLTIRTINEPIIRSVYKAFDENETGTSGNYSDEGAGNLETGYDKYKYLLYLLGVAVVIAAVSFVSFMIKRREGKKTKKDKK